MKINKKLVLFSLVLLCLAGMSAVEMRAQDSRYGGSPVYVYDRRDANGTGQGFDVGTYRNNRSEFGYNLKNDTASSVRVDNGYRVRLCENEGYGGNGDGRCEEFAEGTHNLRYDNTASFIRVTRQGGGGGGSRGIVTVYDDRDYRGTWQTFDTGRYRYNSGEFGRLRNDEASSIVISRGYRVRLCESEGGDRRGAGRCEELNEGSYNLRLNDEISFIEVRRSGGGGGGGWGDDKDGVVLYTEKSQRGDEQVFDVGTYRNDYRQLGRIGNDNASSVYVSPGYRVRICETEGGGNGAGRCEEYGAGNYNLRYNDTASFIRVWRGR